MLVSCHGEVNHGLSVRLSICTACDEHICCDDPIVVMASIAQAPCVCDLCSQEANVRRKRLEAERKEAEKVSTNSARQFT